MEHTAKCLPAYQGGSLLEQLHGQKLAALSNRLEQMERLERNAAALSEHYAGMVLETLDSLTSKEHHGINNMLQPKVVVSAD